MLRVSLLTSPHFFVVAILATTRYGPVGIACAAAAITPLHNVIMVLLAKRKTGMWTHVSLSLSPFRKPNRKGNTKPSGVGPSEFVIQYES
jgi:uncharacterized membrane protein YtjA (UPF0391 family)